MTTDEEEDSNAPVSVTNRDVFGTWRRPFDFTFILIGYIVGIHDFWRFPFLCYKYGGVFFIPFVILNLIMAIPAAFMELTIGQFRGIGATEVFGAMAPILTGVSYLLAWNSLTTCWIYTMMIAWSRLYSSDATSCYQAWGACLNGTYYNTKACFTGRLDDACRDLKNDPDDFFYNFDCISINEFCKNFGATVGTMPKTCVDSTGKEFSIFTQRLHASVEYYYGGICGLQRAESAVTRLDHSVTADPLQVDVHSTIESEISIYSFTTFALIAFFLYEDLLSVSMITYILNGIPFLFLAYFTIRAALFTHAKRGFDELFNSAGSYSFEILWLPEVWVEAMIQILTTSGIGNGVLLNLSTFNKFEHNYVVDALLSALMNTITSFCAAVICFCTIGHHIERFNITVPFTEFIHIRSSHSSLEFGYIVYTQFIALIHEDPYQVVAFFFMITSFSMDSALRLVQNLSDAMVAIFARLRRHRFATLVGICLFGYFAISPLTRNGGVILFMEYEYFLLKFVWPFIVLVQIAGVTWVYRMKRIFEDARSMDINVPSFLRFYIKICLQYVTVALLVFVLVWNLWNHQRKRFDNIISSVWHELFGWVFVSTPVILILLSIFEQFIATDRSKWGSLFQPVVESSGLGPNSTRLSGVSGSNYGPMSTPAPEGRLKKFLEKWYKKQHKEDPEEQSDSDVPKAELPESDANAKESEDQGQKRDESEPEPKDAKKGVKQTWKNFLKKLDAHFETWPGRFDESDKSDDDE